ncbi:MAG: AmmeMemoRadiSam system protein B [Planctomycetes bacterium]|nr:AmmeMemoRadiSam system protein B [Planctomycetota bacterium]
MLAFPDVPTLIWERSTKSVTLHLRKRFASALGMFLLFLTCPPVSLPGLAQERAPAVAGAFYPGEPEELRRSVQTLLDKATEQALPGKPLAMLVPHAGYVYSGETAACAYKSLRGDWDTYLILGSGHRYPVEGAALYAKGSFRTPLGNVPVNEVLCQKLLAECSHILDSPRAHEGEHSIEVQLPFLQVQKREFSIVPMVMNLGAPETLQRIGQAIARSIRDENVLILISSDLSHYPTQEIAQVVDQTTLRSLEFLDPAYFRITSRGMMARRLPGLSCTSCGEAAVLSGLYASLELGADQTVLLRYLNSGDVPQVGDPSRVVGYASMAFVHTGTNGRRMLPKLGDSEKVILHQLAVNTLLERMGGRPLPSSPVFKNPELNLAAPVFVTLKKEGKLRGCIGTVSPQQPLPEAVQLYALKAALEDVRFPPVQRDEVPQLDIEISILSPFQRVLNAEEIQPKMHGVAVSRGGESGLFLPQVWENIPEKERFLSELCSQKAHLPADAWKQPDTALFVFTVEKF